MESNFCPHCTGRVLEILHRLERRHIMDQAQLLNELNIANAGIAKIGRETRTLITLVDDLQSKLASSTNELSPEIVAAVQALNSQIVVVDDLVPDVAPAPAPAPVDGPTPAPAPSEPAGDSTPI